MTKYILTIVDTVGVQDYIFATNSLRQNAGASFLADCATGSWVHEVLELLSSGKHNVLLLSIKEDKYDGRSIEGDHLQAELIYSGGGNAVLLFESLELAKQFTQELTRRVMLHAPGLRIAVNHTEFEWENEALGGKRGVLQSGGRAGVIQCALQSLKEHKQRTPPTYPTLGLGVSSRCVFTGLPVVDYDKDKRPVSAVADAKERQEFNRKNIRDPQTAYGRLLGALEFRNFAPARDFDKLGVSPDESSLIAVVHADGNGMGKRVEAMREQHKKPEQNRAYLNALRSFSASVKKASNLALQETLNLLIANVKITKKEGKDIYYISAESGKDELEGAVKLAEIERKEQRASGERFYLPFRPIVLGGDDTTFVCEGRLGLSLAAYYVQKFTEQTLSDGKKAHCRAGVALVPLHFPFARAYALAEEISKSARNSISEWKKNPRMLDKDGGITAIDWHFAIGGMVRDLKDVRRLEYTSDGNLDNEARHGDMLMRPLRLDAHKDEWRSWPIFIETVKAFRESEVWRRRHNKVKALRTALRKGEKAVQQFRRLYSVKSLPEIHAQYGSFQESGWQGNHCAYFDAIEAVDRLIELDTRLQLGPINSQKEGT
ncbi:MAG: hypothetical protein U0175_21000 [Caldilineaceae bacterium]